VRVYDVYSSLEEVVCLLGLNIPFFERNNGIQTYTIER